MASSKQTIAIAGATGSLGEELTKAFLTIELKDKFANIILPSQKNSPQLEEWSQQGAQIVIYDEENLAQSLQNVDVLVNAHLPCSDATTCVLQCSICFKGDSFREKLLRAVPDTKIRLYFPSDFGVDHTFHDFSHPEWDAKKSHHALSQKLLDPSKTKMCRMFIALFLDDSVGPCYGFDTDANQYEAVGSVNTQALDESDDPVRYLRFLMGDGSIDHRLKDEGGRGNDNELVNPEEKQFRWRTIQQHVKEISSGEGDS